MELRSGYAWRKGLPLELLLLVASDGQWHGAAMIVVIEARFRIGTG